ncbi:NitT/TauT family transport system permease protein [Sphingobacterium zeae]|uniref:NitT/TauT family transport system permease protein n=1 Tax=Sphingobacterium zeae TaxID=1776859 RepID=A0ABU0UC14_9SPHI|nr:ABC transporter permease [Sphingobacterium zeae]MDQ1152394.1 NitT/TauT family transport system permease protein [Sphingobacterium zeae]
MKEKQLLLPISSFAGFFAIWQILIYFNVFPEYALPSPATVLGRFKMEFSSFRIFNDIIVSLWRVAIGFSFSAILAIPLGLWIGENKKLKMAFIPFFNFFRFLSPLSWIPFAILWFHIGDKPAIFLIFLSTFFPLIISVISALATIPDIYFRVASEYTFKKKEVLYKITLPAIMPQLITSLRVCFGISWVVIIAAEMVGCQDGLGYGIWDARNGLSLDTAICYMIVIGLLGLVMDRAFVLIAKAKYLKWGYGNRYE